MDWLSFLLGKVPAPSTPVAPDPAGISGLSASMTQLLALAQKHSQPTGNPEADARRRAMIEQDLMPQWELERQRLRDPRVAWLIRQVEKLPPRQAPQPGFPSRNFGGQI